ncbi:MAG: hypothetical protein DMG70_01705 [Acidobacteria bacterium]|nr:MAG: hypothetical protein DMG70_01705 [Acidobacteriota bacterium]
MFDWYSERARRVIFFARLESGARGAEMIDLDDLITALIMEDQNRTSDALLQLRGGGIPVYPGSTRHQPFLPADVATILLEKIQGAMPRSSSIPTSADMGISSVLRQTLAAASDLRERLQSEQVTPLHLLAVVLAGSHPGVQMLRDAGITEEKVIGVLRSEGQL